MGAPVPRYQPCHKRFLITLNLMMPDFPNPEVLPTSTAVSDGTNLERTPSSSDITIDDLSTKDGSTYSSTASDWEIPFSPNACDDWITLPGKVESSHGQLITPVLSDHAHNDTAPVLEKSKNSYDTNEMQGNIKHATSDCDKRYQVLLEEADYSCCRADDDEDIESFNVEDQIKCINSDEW